MIEFLTGLCQLWIDFSPLNDVLSGLGVVLVCECIFEATRGKKL